MKYFSTLIKPASSKCNINCKYCFYSDISNTRCIKDYGIMSESTMYNLISKTLNFFNEEVTITYSFQGGEPTLAGLNFFINFVNIVNKLKKDIHKINYTIQTNMTLINDKWCVFFKENNFLVGASLDGFMLNHNLVRVKGENTKTYELVMKNINLLKKYNIEFNILTVLTSKLSKNPKKLFDFYLKNNFKYIQLIPCLPANDKIHDDFSLLPKDFFNFYNTFFKLWFKEYKNNNYISISYFDNLISLFCNVRPSQCGTLGSCSMQFVIEGNGNIYPCDFYALDKYKLGNINDNSIIELYKSKILNNFIEEEKTSCLKCKTCKYLKICNGQCKKLSICYYDKNYCGLLEFMRNNEKDLLDISKNILSKYKK